jgi:hypothetical protein
MPKDDAPAVEGTPEPTPAAPAPEEPHMTVSAGKAFGVAKDIAALLVIPAFLWIIKLEVGNAERDIILHNQAEQIDDLEGDIEDAQDIEDGVQSNALKLAVLEGKLDTANGRLGEIITLFRRP